MNIEYTDDGYLEVSFQSSEPIDYKYMSNMNTAVCFIPSFRNRYDESSILYYRGEMITVSEYITNRTLSFDELKELLLQITYAFQDAINREFEINKILAELEYIFIHPQNKYVKLIYLPLIENKTSSSFQHLLRKICNRVNTQGASMLLGMMLEKSNQKEFILEKFYEDLVNVDDCNIKPKTQIVEKIVEVPRIVEKTVEVPKMVEKIVEVPRIEKHIIIQKHNTPLCITAVIMELLVGIISPCIFSSIFEITNNTKIIVMSVVVTFIANILTILINNILKKTQTEEKIIQKSQKRQVNNTSADMNHEQNQKFPNRIEKQNMNYDTKSMYKKDNKIENEDELDETVVVYNPNISPTTYLIEEGKTSIMDRIFIEGDEFIIGRDESANFMIVDSTISKRHAVITKENNEYYITDLESRNGTTVNNKVLKGKTQLLDGYQITFGGKKYLFSRK